MKIHSTIIDYDKIIFVGCFGIFIDCLLIEIAMFYSLFCSDIVKRN